MQVEKRHYAINLLLLMGFYISFLPIDIPNFRQIISIILNVMLIRKILSRSKIQFTIVIGTIFEVMSSGIIGCFVLKYFVMRKIFDYANENLVEISSLELIVITFLAIASATCLELLIKIYLGFKINDAYYALIVLGSIASITFMQYLLKPSSRCKSSLYRH